MFKFVLPLVIAISCANAATIGLSLFCPGAGSFQSSPTSESCSNGFQSAFVAIDANGDYQDILGGGTYSSGSPAVRTSVSPVHCVGPCVQPFVASGTFIDDYVLTISGGMGQGFFVPCMFADGVLFGASFSSASASFGSQTVRDGASCVQPFPSRPLIQLLPTPFTFGVPQTFTVSLSVQGVDASSVYADLWGFQFVGAFGRPITNAHFTLVSVDLPEPSTLSLLGMGLIFFLAVRSSKLVGLRSRLRPTIAAWK